jgi:hypothetical protein
MMGPKIVVSRQRGPFVCDFVSLYGIALRIDPSQMFCALKLYVDFVRQFEFTHWQCSAMREDAIVIRRTLQ